MCDKTSQFCKCNNKDVFLPQDAYLTINRCNLPANLLGELVFQQYPVALKLDGVAEIYRSLFDSLNLTAQQKERTALFHRYMTAHFCLEDLEQAGLDSQSSRERMKANYIRILRGWSFHSDGREGAVLKGWVESRFGLVPRHHIDPLRGLSDAGYLRFLAMRTQGLYGTNALEAQLDLVYAYCQYEFHRLYPEAAHLTLYRGVNRINEYEWLASRDKKNRILLLNNLNSFSCQRERAEEFGDYILTVQVPTAKIFFYCGLLPKILQGEDEFLVIGGIYEVEFAIF